jgi:hypothetical protein
MSSGSLSLSVPDIASTPQRFTLAAASFTITRAVVVQQRMPLDDGLAHHGLILVDALLR